MLDKTSIQYSLLLPQKQCFCCFKCLVLLFVILWSGLILYSTFSIKENVEKGNVKTILAINGIAFWWPDREGSDLFKNKYQCPVSNCLLISDPNERETADLILFHDRFIPSNKTRPSNQIYALYHLESPFHTTPVETPDAINWTITYRHDSTIPIPYSTWTYFDPEIIEKVQTQNFAANKTKKLAWFVSNCQHKNGRWEYARELQKYIEVDIYGKCGNLSCEISDNEKCFNVLNSDYKFYLAFENSNCKNYITEKLFWNSLRHNILPIVMGASREDYENYLPSRSYIHVEDFKSPKDLAEYLHILDKNDDLYNSYFKWKGTGQIKDSWKFLWCRLCEMLHNETSITDRTWYPDVNNWWRGPGACTTGRWRDLNQSAFDNNDYIGSRQFDTQLRLQKPRVKNLKNK